MHLAKGLLSIARVSSWRREATKIVNRVENASAEKSGTFSEGRLGGHRKVAEGQDQGRL